MRRFFVRWLRAAFHPESPPLVSAVATVGLMAAVVVVCAVLAVAFALVETLFLG